MALFLFLDISTLFFSLDFTSFLLTLFDETEQIQALLPFASEKKAEVNWRDQAITQLASS